MGTVFPPILMPLLSCHCMSKGTFEWIAFSLSRFRLVRYASFLWLRRLNLTASSKKIDLNVAFGFCDLPLMNCLPSAVGFASL